MDSDTNFEFESDIVDQHCQTETEPPYLPEDDIPPRPSSRLSFNRTMIDSPLFTEEETTALHMSISGEPRWPRVLLQTVGMTNMDKTDMDITTLCSSEDGSFEPSPLSDQVEFDYNNANSHEGEDATVSELVSSCETFDDDDDEIPFSSFEYLQSASDFPSFAPSPADCSSWTLQPKYSCLPSPLSTRYISAKPYSFRHIPHRHVYRQHGYSRHSLLHLKWFWANREEEWMAHTDRLRNSKTHDSLSMFRDVVPPPTLRYPGCRAFGIFDGSQAPQDVIPRLPPMSIHPRRGDILTLRDPYCMHIDRFFVGMPLWTMGKMLWMYDVHVATETRNQMVATNLRPGVRYEEAEDDFYEEERSEAESVETAGSADSSDDSDATLVESESEGDLSKCVNSSGSDTLESDVEPVKSNQFSGIDNPSLRIYGSSSLPFRRSHNADPVSGALLAPATPRQIQNTTCSNMHPRSSDQTRPPWITCWYRRWDLLTELVRNDRKPPMESHDSSGTPSSSNTKPSKFYLADDESWSDVLDLDDNDTVVENAIIMPNPIYDSSSNHQAQCAQV